MSLWCDALTPIRANQSTGVATPCVRRDTILSWRYPLNSQTSPGSISFTATPSGANPSIVWFNTPNVL